jgi:hypothetical protein
LLLLSLLLVLLVGRRLRCRVCQSQLTKLHVCFTCIFCADWLLLLLPLLLPRAAAAAAACRQEAEVQHMSVNELQELLANPVLVRSGSENRITLCCYNNNNNLL